MSRSAPTGWTTRAVGDLFELQLGKMLNKKAREATPQFPYLGNRDVQWGSFDFSAMRQMHFDAREREKYKLVPGDLLVCEGGEVGRTALWTGGMECYFQKALHRLRRKCASVESGFMFHFMRHAANAGLLSDLTSQSSIAHLTREKLTRLRVLLPPLPEQRKIAAILSSVDEFIERTEAVIEQLQVVKKAMMQELLTRGIPGRHKRFKKTEIGEIPEEWDVVTLGDLGGSDSLQTGPFGSQLKASEYTADGVPVVMPKDLVGLRVSSRAVSRVAESRAVDLTRHRVRPGDVLFARRGDIGRCGLITDRETGWLCGTGCLRARLGDAMEPLFLVHVVDSKRVRNWLVEHAVGQTMLNLNTKILGAVPLPLPLRDEQKKIAAFAESIDERISYERGGVKSLRHLKSSLMSVLLTGEVRVKPDEEAA